MLRCTPYEVLALEKQGLLHPRRDRRGRRTYRAPEVAALAATRAASRGKLASGEIEATILDLVDAGRSDAEIVRVLRVPFDAVARVRAALAGEPPPPLLSSDEEHALDRERAQRAAHLDARRKARRQRRET